MAKRLYYKFDLAPAPLYLEVWIGEYDSVAQSMERRYGKRINPETIKDGFCTLVESTPNSTLKGKSVMMIWMVYYDAFLLSHELIHLLFFIEEYAGFEITTDSQEWIAYYYGSLFEKIDKAMPHTCIKDDKDEEE